MAGPGGGGGDLPVPTWEGLCHSLPTMCRLVGQWAGQWCYVKKKTHTTHHACLPATQHAFLPPSHCMPEHGRQPGRQDIMCGSWEDRPFVPCSVLFCYFLPCHAGISPPPVTFLPSHSLCPSLPSLCSLFSINLPLLTTTCPHRSVNLTFSATAISPTSLHMVLPDLPCRTSLTLTPFGARACFALP